MSGLVLFEDYWPHNGDLDFNDQAIAYNFEFLFDTNGNVATLQATFNVLAVGASIHNGAYLHLPLTLAGNPVAVVDQNNNTITPIQTETDLVVPIVNDTRSLFATQTPFINTEASLPVETGTPVMLTFTFANGAALDPSAIPYDLFIARSTDFAFQIHMPQYPGTDAMNTALFGTGDDRSNQDLSASSGIDNTGLWFVNENGLPFALSLPQVIAWPQEKVAIDTVYGELDQFASSGGADYPNWYGEDINPTPSFTQGAGSQPPPAPLSAGPDLVCNTPVDLVYKGGQLVCRVDEACTLGRPSNDGGAITAYSISPDLPAGLTFNTSTGAISGTPTAIASPAAYTVTASNSAGSTSATVKVAVFDALDHPDRIDERRRDLHCAALLQDGRVLVVGGNTFGNTGSNLASAELYDPASGTFTDTGSLNHGRAQFTATTLPSGLVFIAGGAGTSTELFDPSSGTFSEATPLLTARYAHTATLLPNGKVLLAGGLGPNGDLASASSTTRAVAA